MFSNSFDKMPNGMRWLIIIPTSLLLFSIAWFVFSFTAVTRDAQSVQIDAANGKASIRVIDDILSKTQNLSNYLDQQQTELTVRQNRLDEKLNQAKTDPKKFLENNITSAIAGLNAANNGVKDQSVQLAAQQKNIKALQDELTQLKQALKQKS